MKKLLTAVAALALLMTAGCTSEPSKPAQAEKPQPKAPDMQTGRYAFQKLYIAAHGWARDAQPFRRESQLTADCKGKDGKADVWCSSFASPAGRSVKPYGWSGTDAPGPRPRSQSRLRRQLQSHQLIHSGLRHSVFESGFRQSSRDRPETRWRQTPRKESGHPHRLCSRLEPRHQRTHLARDLRRHPRRRQANRGHKRHHGRFHPSRKVVEGAPPLAFVARSGWVRKRQSTPRLFTSATPYQSQTGTSRRP